MDYTIFFITLSAYTVQIKKCIFIGCFNYMSFFLIIARNLADLAPGLNFISLCEG